MVNQTLRSGIFFFTEDNYWVLHVANSQSVSLSVPIDNAREFAQTHDPRELHIYLDYAMGSLPSDIRFYAAAPLSITNVVIGFLFVIDDKPRVSCPISDKMALLELGDAVSVMLCRRRRLWAASVMDSLSSMRALLSTASAAVNELSASFSALKSSLDSLSSSESTDANSPLHKDAFAAAAEFQEALEGISLFASASSVAPPLGALASVGDLFRYLSELLPMLVTKNRVQWDLDSNLRDVTTEDPSVLFSVLVMLLIPLTLLSTAIRIRVKFTPQHRPESKVDLQLGNREVLGVVKVSVKCSMWNSSSPSSMEYTLNSVRRSLEELKSGLLEPFSATFDDSKNAVYYKFSLRGSSGHSSSDSTLLAAIEESPLKVPSTDYSREDSRPPSVDLLHQAESEAGRKVVSVLIVDDSTMIQKLLKKAFLNLGCDVDSALNGSECLTKIRSAYEAPDCKIYDLILMDFLMPVMDGLETMKEIQKWRSQNLGANLKYAQSLLIGLSATADATERSQGFDYGMHHFIPKPPDMKALTRVVASLKISESTEKIIAELKASS